MLTNDESTWTNIVPATDEEQEFFDRSYVPMLSQAYIYEHEGGATEVEVTYGETWADNDVGNGGLNEDKTSLVSLSGQDKSQFKRYLAYLQDNPNAPLCYNFFASPSHDNFGPYGPFANALAEAAVIFDIRVQIHPEG